MTTLAQSFYSPDPAVIVASSNPGIRKQIMQNLLLSRISAAEALGGADALGKLESSECQLLFLDRRLPDLDADELLQIIHRRFPGIDVLLLDDAGNPALPSQWRSAGAHLLFDTMGQREGPRATAGPLPVSLTVEPLPGMVGPIALHAQRLPHGASGGAAHHAGADHGSPAAPARKSWRMPFIASVRAPARSSWLSIALPFRRRCWSRNYSAMCAALSPARCSRASGAFTALMAAHCFSTR